MSETELEMAERHVRQGQEHIARQHEIIKKLELLGVPTAEAKLLLQNFEDVQAQHLAYRDRLLTSI